MMFQLWNNDRFRDERSEEVKGKKDSKKKGTLRPWLVDVCLTIAVKQ